MVLYNLLMCIKARRTLGSSIGSGPNTIPSRLQRGEPADVVILAASALDELIEQGKVVAGSRVDLVRSRIGMAVRAGAKAATSLCVSVRRTEFAREMWVLGQE